MKICRECGSKIGEKDQFCIGCGARVYRGEECESYIYDEVYEESAPAVEADNKTAQKTSISRGKFKFISAEMLGFIVDVYSRPVASGVKYGRKPVKEASMILSFLMALVLGLISIWAAGKVNGTIKIEFVTVFDIGQESYFKALATFIVSYLMLLFSLSFGLFVSGQLLYNVRARFLGLWNIAVVVGVLYTTAVVLIVLLAYLFPSLIVVFVIFIGLIAVISLYQGAKDVMELTEDRAALTVGVAVIIMILMIYLVGKI